MPRWPLIPIALPAAVAIWSGWVGLGGLCGFGPVNLLPGIGGGFHLNTAICLPVGMEAYAAFALAVWLRSTPVPDDARAFARRSAFGALVLGVTGQVIYHLLAAAHVTRAPWPVVMLVSCLPVAVVGLAAALAHLMSRAQGERTEPEPETVSVPASVTASLPGLREIQRRRNCSQGTAKKILAELRAYERGRGGSPTAVLSPAPAAQVPPAGELPPQLRPAPAGAVPSLNGYGERSHD